MAHAIHFVCEGPVVAESKHIPPSQSPPPSMDRMSSGEVDVAVVAEREWTTIPSKPRLGAWPSECHGEQETQISMREERQCCLGVGEEAADWHG